MKKTYILFTSLLLFFNISFSLAQTWDQIGSSLLGTIKNSGFGVSISFNSDASIMAIGTEAFNSDTTSGYVKVFEWNGLDWAQKGSDLIGDSIGDTFGLNVALSADGNTLIVGAPNNDVVALYSGQAKVFEWNGVDWVQKGLSFYGNNEYGVLGIVSISSDGNTIAMGSSGNNGVAFRSGRVQMFDWNGTSWVQKGQNIDGANANDSFGISCKISADGNSIIIGATQYNNLGTTQNGYAKAYEWDGVNWVQKGSAILGEAPADYFGYATDISSDGSTIAVVSYSNDNNGIDAGQTKIYYWDGSDWVQKGITIYGKAAGDGIGGMSAKLSANGNIIAIGASGNDDNGNNTGNTRVFKWNGTAWNQKGIDIYGEMPGDFFGTRIALTENGNRLAVGARYNDESYLNGGKVKVFDFCSFLERTDSITLCNNEYTWIDGNTYTESNYTATFTSANTNACDSLINLKLTLNTTNTDVVQDGTSLIAAQSNVLYQWINCDDNNAILLNENNQTFVATTNGNYALEINNNNCIDTSTCYAITNVSIEENYLTENITVFPNPNSGSFIIGLNKDFTTIKTEIYDYVGTLIDSKVFLNNEIIQLQINAETGFYLVHIINENEIIAKVKVLKL